MPPLQIEEKRLGCASRALHRHIWWHAQIEEQFCTLGSTADAPWLSAADAAEIGDAFVPAMHRFLLPTLHPFQYHAEHIVETPDRVALRASLRKRRVDIHAGHRNAHPQ